jgi:hypothetical protein
VGGNLTPKQARDALAIPVYAVVSGYATPIFPTTNLASWSSLVGIFMKPGGSCRTLRRGQTAFYPVWVNGRQWERAVVPVLLDPRWNASNPLFQFVAFSSPSEIIRLIGEALAQSFHDAGYGPLP